MHPTRTVLMSLTATAAFAMAGVAEPQVVEYSRSGIDYVATIYTNANETEVFTVPDGVESIDYLVVGGGGGGGGKTEYGGGGGAGGMKEDVLAVTPGDELVVQVGAGGAGATSASVSANGEPSSISRNEVALVTVAGGGAGGCGDVGSEGACGGGGAKSKVGGTGTVGYNGFAGSSSGGGAGGGGMGSGGNSQGTAPIVGTPGVGLASEITGESVTYAAGGAGGSLRGPAPAAGADGTGNGGGGAKKGQADGFKGGSGVVVIRYAKPGSKKLNGWVREPSLGETVLVAGEGTTIDCGEAKSGTEVRASYTEDDLKGLPKGAHSITFTVDESDEWSSLEKTIDFSVRSMKFPTPGDPDTVLTTYTWNGGEGYWCDLSNWSADVTPCFGYPNSSEFASAVVSSEATVKADPDGDMFGPAEVKDLTLSAPVTLTGGVFNVAGTLKATDEVRVVDSTLSMSKANHLFSGNAVFSNSTLAGTGAQLYAFGDGTVFVEEGAASTNEAYRLRIGFYDKVRSTGTRYVVKSGAGFKPRGISVGAAGSKNVGLIVDNTAIDFDNGVEIAVVAGVTNSFVELKGADAKLIVTKGTLTLGTEDGAEQTSGLCFRMPSQPYASAPVVKKAGTGSGQLELYGNAVIKLDVTDVLHKGKFPLVEDARGAFGVGITAAGGDAEAYLAMLQSNLKVVALRADGSEKICKGRVTLSIEDGVLYASVKSSSGLALIVR